MHETMKTQKWWMIFKLFVPEPFKLWMFYILSMGVTLLLLSASAFYACTEHGLWTKIEKFSGQKLPFDCISNNCKKQKDHWNKLIQDEQDYREAAQKRINELKIARSDPANKNFTQPWSWFESEINQLEKIKKPEDPSGYQIKPIIWSFPFFMATILGSLLFYILISRLALLHAKFTFGQRWQNTILQDLIRDWKTPQILIGIMISAGMITSELFTSVFVTEGKTLFGYDSFCITPYAFVIKCIAYVTFGFVAATPFTILWCLSRSDYIPLLDQSAKDGKFGAERYVEFLQTWTLWLILAPSALGIFLLRHIVKIEKVFSYVRLLYGLGVAIIIFMIVVRLITNAIILRFRCREALLDKKIKKADKVPVDPTISFLGMDWWKLPATIGVSLASIWAILEFMGLSKFISSILQIGP
jgi:hypothetical protein